MENGMTVRVARIVSSDDRGPSTHGFVDDDGYRFIDTSPDHLEVKFEPVNCTLKEFLAWFVFLNEYRRYELIPCSDGSFIDLAGSPLDLTLGTEITITFDEYFEALIETRISEAKRKLAYSEEHPLLMTPVSPQFEEGFIDDFDIPYD
jgi:hypothetical protein